MCDVSAGKSGSQSGLSYRVIIIQSFGGLDQLFARAASQATVTQQIEPEIKTLKTRFLFEQDP